jgi:phage baseplate assembly protein W
MASVRGIRFDGAELAGATSALRPPAGLVLSPAGRLSGVGGHEAVRQAIILLLTTIPGERVMRPGYGCPLHRLMFAPNDATTAGLAIHYVRQSIKRWEPRIEIVRLDAGVDPAAPSQLTVSLDYRVRGNNQPGQLDFALDLRGEAA